ncbi:hypothetical protein ACG33_13410 [Steroidobacter denitrificans]|uniref:Antitoxin SocA-like Panacea domain-containing protein n=1 Tax=Steroidobacter denitrificans TaxID=465721 RepID=A0A127FE11_STEDE|nr:Panacea domain-containing protein [Steroidobacter denitrificans]AMN48080.1 hypothetical protein ACG33_13410 [Steroidobacter denitrificans]
MGRFRFDFDKGLEAIIYIAARIPDPTFHHISKVLYFADLDHLANYGRFVAGDRYIAMEYGPVPSNVHNIMRAGRGAREFVDQKEAIKNSISVPGRYTVHPLRESRNSIFSRSDLECIDRSIAKYGRKSFGQLVDESHDAAWRATSEGQEMSLLEIARMMEHTEEVLEHLEIADERAA